MIDYIVRFLQEAYDFINPGYTNGRMAKFYEFKESGRLEKTTFSEFEGLFGISGIGEC